MIHSLPEIVRGMGAFLARVRDFCSTFLCENHQIKCLGRQHKLGVFI